MTILNYNEFQAGQGVSAPALNENFSLVKSAIENLEVTLNSTVTSLTSTANLKADKTGSASEKFNVAEATEDTNAVNYSQLKKAAPIGTVIWYAGAHVPDGYLLCDGAEVSRELYPELFSVIGVIYGAGNGVDTFQLPLMTDGRFAQGYTSSGQAKDAGLPNITGEFGNYWNGGHDGYSNGAFSKRNGSVASYDGGGGNNGKTWINSFDASRSSSVYGNSDTVQPKALTLLPCIKY